MACVVSATRSLQQNRATNMAWRPTCNSLLRHLHFFATSCHKMSVVRLKLAVSAAAVSLPAGHHHRLDRRAAGPACRPPTQCVSLTHFPVFLPHDCRFLRSVLASIDTLNMSPMMAAPMLPVCASPCRQRRSCMKCVTPEQTCVCCRACAHPCVHGWLLRHDALRSRQCAAPGACAKPCVTLHWCLLHESTM